MRFAYCALVLIAFTLPAIADSATSITEESLAAHPVWTKERSPYVVDGDLYVSTAPSPLAIEAGVVVKFTPGSSIVFGENIGLDIQGTAAEPVYFTSLKDDSVGGDTNGDGSASTPAPGDWSFAEIVLNRGNVGLSHLKIRYAGAPDNTGPSGPVSAALLLVSARTGTFRSVEHIEVSRSATVGVRTQVGQNGSLTILNSSFFDNERYAMERDRRPNAFGKFDLAGLLDVRENWWGDSSGPLNAGGNPGGLGDEIAPLADATSQPILFDPWLSENPMPDPTPPPEEPEVPDPVVIIPGILGSEEHNGEWVIDPILHTYDDLIATLDVNGYTPGEDLFPFPYNWRKSNVETALLLKEKIDEIKEICECDKVDIVAHSMGGLVARQYIQSDDYADDVDQLIFLGTPHLGAPKAYLMWEGGTVGPNFGLRREYFTNFLFDEVLSFEAKEYGYNNVFEYLRNTPISSVEQLLPIYDYITDEGVLREYPNNYPANEFLENLDNDLQQFLESGVKISNFVGDTGATTISGIDAVDIPSLSPKWEHGYPRLFDAPLGNHGLVRGVGDETVPTVSSSHITSNLETYALNHSELVTDTQADVFEILTGEDPSTVITDRSGFLNNLLIFKILSPADFFVIAPDGKKIGKDFNGQEVNQITNAFYTGFNTDTEFVTIPNPLEGDYKIFTQGTGSGTYTVEADFISEATTTEAAFTGNTAPGIKSELKMEVEEEGIVPDSLEIVVTYDSALTNLDRIYALKLIHTTVYKSLKAQLQKAKKTQPFVAKLLLQAMMKQLDGYRGTLLKEQGYQILKADIDWLINN